MDMKKIKIFLVLEEPEPKEPEEGSTEVLNIQVMLGEKGLYWAISAEKAGELAFDCFLGRGWTKRFANELGDVLAQNRELNKLLIERGKEIVVGVTKKMREEGRL